MDAAESFVLGQCEQDLSTSSRQTLRDSAEEPNALEFISGGASHRCHFFPWEPSSLLGFVPKEHKTFLIHLTLNMLSVEQCAP